MFIRNIYEYHVGRVLSTLSTAANKVKRRRNQNKKDLKRLQQSPLLEEDHKEVWEKRTPSRPKPKFVGSRRTHKIKTNIDAISKQKMFDDVYKFVISNAEKMDKLRHENPTANSGFKHDIDQSNSKAKAWNPFPEELQKKIEESNGQIEIAVKNGRECDIDDDPDAIYLNGSIIVLHNPTRKSEVEGITSIIKIKIEYSCL